MPFFSRKSKNIIGEQWDKSKNEYDGSIERCYAWEKVSLSLCSFEQFVSFNSYDRLSGERKPLFKHDYEFHGVLSESHKFERHVPCVLIIHSLYGYEDGIGRFVLTHTILDEKTPT